MLTSASLRHAIIGIAAVLENEHAQLTELDGKMGDGDLGLTLLKAFRALDGIKDALPADLGQAFLLCGSTASKVSSSSFGTLMATAFLAAAKALRGRESAAWSETSQLLSVGVAAMMARGKASLGDKTVLDPLDAVATAIAGLDDPAAQLSAAKAATEATIAAFGDKPNRIGRARVYAEKSIGLDDPGMVAIRVMLAGL